MKKNYSIIILITVLLVLSQGSSQVQIHKYEKDLVAEKISQFEQQVKQLRQNLPTPSLAAAIVKDRELIWAKGFGLANIEEQIPATPDTPYRLASVTKIFASTLIMQLVEQEKVNLEDPVSMYGIELESEGVITVRHLLSHTSENPPGMYYRYNGGRFLHIGTIIEKVSGKSFRECVIEKIIKPLGMTNTAPHGIFFFWDRLFYRLYGYGKNEFDHIYYHLAVPYGPDNKTPAEYRDHFSASAGLISTVNDLSKFDIALDNNLFISKKTQAYAWTPTTSTNGEILPYGLGWFTQEYQGTWLIWHYGYWDCTSTLLLKVPAMNITFIILTNTDQLSQGFNLGLGDVLTSPAARLFLNTFVFPGKFD